MALNIVTEEKSEVVVNGTSYLVAVPSLKELSELQKKVKILDEVDHSEAYQDFFSALGLPKSVSDKFGAKHWKLLLEEVTGAKKS